MSTGITGEPNFLHRNNVPGIPKAFEDGYFQQIVGQGKEPLHCLLMDKVEGENLKSCIEKRGAPINESTAKDWLTQLLNIIEAIHRQEIIHRDISPQNIILQPNLRLSLIDFGAVFEKFETSVNGTEMATGVASSPGTSILKNGYTPPEQMSGHTVKQSDFFALGRMFIFLLTACEPQSMYVPYEDEVQWRHKAPKLSLSFANLIDQMQERKVSNRPQNCQVILQKLSNTQANTTNKQTQTRGFVSYPPPLSSVAQANTTNNQTQSRGSVSYPPPLSSVAQANNIRSSTVDIRQFNSNLIREAKKKPKSKSGIIVILAVLISGIGALVGLIQRFQEDSRPSIITELPDEVLGSNETNDLSISRPPAEETIDIYWKLINAAAYERAFANLTPYFQLKNGGWEAYVKWWEKVDSVQVNDITHISQNSENSTVECSFKLWMLDGKEKLVSWKIYLHWDNEENRWKINETQNI